jgi:2'-5' RNA ligase
MGAVEEVALPDLPDTIRAFVAIRMSAQVESAIAAAIEELRTPPIEGIRFTVPGNLHLTLKFLGNDAPVDRIRAMLPGLQSACRETLPFEVVASGLGAFPDMTRPRVLWVGLHSESLVSLAKRIDDVATNAGFNRESRPFRAHLTIGRVNNISGWHRIRRKFDAMRERSFGSIQLNLLTVYRSRMGPQGSRYDALATFPLGR